MTTGKFISQLEALTKKIESFVQSIQCSGFHPSKEQYQAIKGLGLRLRACATNLPIEIEALKNRLAEPSVEEGRKLIVQAQSEKRDLMTTAQLKNRVIFARNITYFFDCQRDSVVDSDATKARKQLTRERCERICSLSADGLITWAVAFMPTTWTANLMSKDTFDYVFEHIEPDSSQVWPPDIYHILSGLRAEEPLRGSHRYHGFLKAAEDEQTKAQGSNQQRKRRYVADGPTPEDEPSSAVQTSDLASQPPAGEYASGRVQLPGLRQMALVPLPLSHNQTQDREDLTTGGNSDINRQRHPMLHCQDVHPSSMRSGQEEPAAADSLLPYTENREMKDMYTNAPASNISKMPEPFRTAVQNSRLWKWERSQTMERTGCWPILFPKDHTQDVSFTIWCSHNDGYYLTNFFGTQLEISS